MSAQGYGRVAYEFMASKTGYSRRTAIRHMHRLVALRVFAKTVYKLQNGYAINLYKCLLAVPAFYRDRAQRAGGDRVSPVSQSPRQKRRKRSRWWTKSPDGKKPCASPLKAAMRI